MTPKVVQASESQHWYSFDEAAFRRTEGCKRQVAARKPVTLITGASAGIGAELAEVFAAHGHATFLVARRFEKLKEVAERIASAGHPRPFLLATDLTQSSGPEDVARALAAAEVEPEILVNNAGFGLNGSAADLSRSEQLTMIDLNVRALTDLSLRFIDSLARHRGGIINLASVASFFPGPGMAVYFATKAFVLSFSEALSEELAPKGIRVMAVCPGPVPTEFQARAGMSDEFSPLLLREADSVARRIYAAYGRGKRLLVPGFANRFVTLVPRFLPRGLLLKLVYANRAKSRTPR
jgi:short-subunit dehydrogenase